MKEIQTVKMTMYGGAIVLLDKNSDLYKDNKGFVKQKTKFYTKHNELLSRAGEAGIRLTGFTDLKGVAKQELADNSSMYCGFAYTILEELGLHDISAQLLINPSDYMQLTDSEIAVKAQSMHKLLSDQQTVITDDYLTVLQLTTMQATIDNFISTKGTTTSEHTAGPVATLAFENAFIPVDAAIASMLTMGKAFKITEPDFYNNLIAATTLPAGHIRHTYVSIALTAKTGGTPITNATGAIVKLNKSGKANEAGVIKMERVRHGTQVITITAPGFKPMSINAAIQSGRQNDLNVEMEGVN